MILNEVNGIGSSESENNGRMCLWNHVILLLYLRGISLGIFCLSSVDIALFVLPRTSGECTTQIVYVSDCVCNCVFQCESVCACTCVMAFTCLSSGWSTIVDLLCD